MAKFCKYCGAPLDENMEFCKQCGKPVRKGNPQGGRASGQTPNSYGKQSGRTPNPYGGQSGQRPNSYGGQYGQTPDPYGRQSNKRSQAGLGHAGGIGQGEIVGVLHLDGGDHLNFAPLLIVKLQTFLRDRGHMFTTHFRFFSFSAVRRAGTKCRPGV